MSNVDHPKHYNDHPAGIECIDVVEHMTFNAGNAVKYLWRAGLKGDALVEDLEKAAWYTNREIQRVTKMRARCGAAPSERCRLAPKSLCEACKAECGIKPQRSRRRR